jgi:hypothetical protein
MMLAVLAEEGRALAVRLLAYLCGIAVLALIAADIAAKAVPAADEEPVNSLPEHTWTHAWTPASRVQPAFAAPIHDFSAFSESYEILRHPLGGRKDFLSWSADDNKTPSTPPVARIELYRPGEELAAFGSATHEIAARAAGGNPERVQAAGIIETKFGDVPLVRFSRRNGAVRESCIGFARSFETPHLQISGWSCQGDGAPAQRRTVACALDRLTMLSAGNDPNMAQLFARAELRRAGCGPNPSPQSDWVTSTGDPLLRGSFAAIKTK